jgi:hypothetical protein|tara:strand:- start:4740 stop:5015 length:276 start_codon:yes stop_codon:yes gene_type:complete
MCKKMVTKKNADFDVPKLAYAKGDYVRWYLTDPHGDIVMRGGTGIVLKAVPTTLVMNKSFLQYKVWCTDLNEKLWFSEEDLNLICKGPVKL